jgi:hypothetical protein
MKKLLVILLILLPVAGAIACPACEKQQPKLLQGITHGAGPSGPMDMVIVWFMVAIVFLTLFFSVKWIIRPGEKSAGHIKRFILHND